MEENHTEIEATTLAEQNSNAPSVPQKRERSEKQKAVWQKAIQTRQSNLENALYMRLKERFDADELEKLRKLQVMKDGSQQLNVLTGRNQTMKGSTKSRHSKKAKHSKTWYKHIGAGDARLHPVEHVLLRFEYELMRVDDRLRRLAHDREAEDVSIETARPVALDHDADDVTLLDRTALHVLRLDKGGLARRRRHDDIEKIGRAHV